jgi:autophagy-related protein 5
MSLPPAAQQQLTTAMGGGTGGRGGGSGGSSGGGGEYEAFASGKAHAAFASVEEQIRKGTLAQLGGGAAAQPRALPLRVCVGPTRWRQLAVAPRLPSGAPCLLVHALAQLMPDTFDADAAADDSGGGGGSGTSEGGAAAEAVGAGEADARVLVQGVHVPLRTPLAWLVEACSHPDGFLYVCCKVGWSPENYL